MIKTIKILIGVSILVVGILQSSHLSKDFSKERLQASSLKSNEEKISQQSKEGDLDLVVRVVDGDTIIVSVRGVEEKIRLIGADTPEVVDPRKPVQCFGKEASKFTKSILSGKRVRLESDETQGDRDKYGRLLRYVFLENDTNFNKMLIENGYAHEYTYKLPYKYQKEFKQAQKDAEVGKMGLWADGVCVK